jgi:hypothetical protein
MSNKGNKAVAKLPPVIQWKENGQGSGECGYVGNVNEWVAQIWRPDDDGQWELIVNLPGKTCFYSTDPDELKERAERIVRWFISDMTSERRYAAQQ